MLLTTLELGIVLIYSTFVSLDGCYCFESLKFVAKGVEIDLEFTMTNLLNTLLTYPVCVRNKVLAYLSFLTFIPGIIFADPKSFISNLDLNLAQSFSFSSLCLHAMNMSSI